MTNEVQALSTDIHVITAEINAYQRVAGEAIFEIGRRLYEVKYNPSKYGLPEGKDKEGRTIVARGAWGEFLLSANTTLDASKWFIAVYIELGDDANRCTYTNKGLRALYEIATLPSEQREQVHTLASGEQKTVDEMTVRELREVKAELKKATEKAEQAEAARQLAEQRELDAKRSAEIANRQNERLSDQLASATKPETVVIEKEVERIVEVDKTDYTVAERLQQYEERFGALENYTDRIRGTNLADVTTSVMTFSKAVREMTKRHAYLAQYQDTISSLDDITKQQYDEAIEALRGFTDLFSPRVSKFGGIVEAVIIDQ